MNTVVQALVNGLALGAQYSLVAVGFALIYGALNVVNFAHGGLYMLGGYVVCAVGNDLGLPYVPALIVAVVAVGVVGLIQERVVFAPIVTDHDSTVIASVGSFMIIGAAVLLIWGTDPIVFKDYPFTEVAHVGAIYVPVAKIIVIVITAASMVAIYLFLSRSRHGLAVRAMADNRPMAVAQGMKPALYFPMTAFIAGALAGLAGGLVGPSLSVDSNMGSTIMLTAFIVVILGGLGSIVGATVAALIVGMIESFAATYIGGSYASLFLFVVILALLLVRPQGLLGREVRSA